MANNIITSRIQQRHDTAAHWTATNPILLIGEMGIETDTKNFKFGDGTTAWNSLGYAKIVNGVPTGGAIGQALVKSGLPDYVTEWAAVGRTNPNLLINWDFRNPVNQRGVTSFPTGQYGIDMWLLGTGSASISTSGLTLSGGYITQRFERALENRTYTVSVMIAGVVHSGQITYAGVDSAACPLGTSGLGAQLVANNNGRNGLVIGAGSTTVIQAVKMEIGTVSTLANDPLADYGATLAKCQYFRSRTMLVRTMASSTSDLYCGSIAFPVTARLATPTVTVMSYVGTPNCVSEWNGSAFVDRGAIVSEPNAYGGTAYSNTAALTTGRIVLFYLVQNSEL